MGRVRPISNVLIAIMVAPRPRQESTPKDLQTVIIKIGSVGIQPADVCGASELAALALTKKKKGKIMIKIVKISTIRCKMIEVAVLTCGNTHEDLLERK